MREHIKSLTIYEVDNGFVAQVGCKTFVFVAETEEQRRAFTDKLSSYIINPGKVEAEWYAEHPEAPREYAVPTTAPIRRAISEIGPSMLASPGIVGGGIP